MLLNELVRSGELNVQEKMKSLERESEYGVDNVFIYYNLLDQKFGDKMTFEQKYKYANQLAIVDKENNYSIAHQTPILATGKGTYSDRIVKSNNEEVWYEYKSDTINKLEKISIMDVKGSGLGGCAYPNNEIQLNIGIFATNMQECYKDDCYNQGFSYSVGSFYHELGHIFAYNSSGGIADPTDDWNEIYNQIIQSDSDVSLIREYCHSSSYECFAEVIAEYYNYDQTASDFYNPNDLKMIEIDYNGYTNLYDYINDFVNAKG